MTAWERGGWWAVTAREREEEGQRGCQSGMGKWVGRRRGGAESGRAPRPGRGWWVVWGCGTWAPGRGGASGAEEGRRRGSGVRGARGAASPERSAAQRAPEPPWAAAGPGKPAQPPRRPPRGHPTRIPAARTPGGSEGAGKRTRPPPQPDLGRSPSPPARPASGRTGIALLGLPRVPGGTFGGPTCALLDRVLVWASGRRRFLLPQERRIGPGDFVLWEDQTRGRPPGRGMRQGRTRFLGAAAPKPGYERGAAAGARGGSCG